MENILEIRNLNLYFGEYQALFGVNLALKKGIMHALVGESGCGKTMTAMSVIRLLPKSASIKSGEIYFNKENLLDLKERQMRDLRGNKIALIPQDPMTSTWRFGDWNLTKGKLRVGITVTGSFRKLWRKL